MTAVSAKSPSTVGRLVPPATVSALGGPRAMQVRRGCRSTALQRAAVARRMFAWLTSSLVRPVEVGHIISSRKMEIGEPKPGFSKATVAVGMPLNASGQPSLRKLNMKFGR